MSYFTFKNCFLNSCLFFNRIRIIPLIFLLALSTLRISSQTDCSRISFTLINTNSCCYQLNFVNSTECYDKLRCLIDVGSFANFSPNSASGWSGILVSPVEILFTHSSGLIPIGSFSPGSFCLSPGPNPNLSILWDNTCAQVGCFTDFPLNACPVVRDSCCPKGSIQGPNLVINGDFELGNSVFNHPCFTYFPSGSTAIGKYSVLSAGTPIVSANPSWACTIDYNPGTTSGKMLIVDGHSTNCDIAWQQMVNVQQGITYSFCAFANNLVIPSKNFDDPIVELWINNTKVQTRTLLESPDQWEPIKTLWSSNFTGLVPIEIRLGSQNDIGNDFAIDDISFQSCAKSDSCSCGTYDFLYAISRGPLLIKHCGDTLLVPSSGSILPIRFISSFNCVGSNCTSSCVDWVLTGPNGSGFTPLSMNCVPANPGFIIPITNATFVYPGIYSLTMTGYCNGKKCSPCTIYFNADGHNCCSNLQDFCNSVMNSIHLITAPAMCKATLNIGNLSACDSVVQINWGEGPIDNTHYGSGSMPMHSYSMNGTYYISWTIFEKDANGKICFDKVFRDSIKTKCCEDFQDEIIHSAGQWQVLNGAVSIELDPTTTPPNSQVLQGNDGSGASWMSNISEYSGDWIQKYGGKCLCFDIRYNSGTSNPATGTSAITIFQNGPLGNINPGLAANRATFVVNNPIGNTWRRVCVPIALAGSILPANTDGKWIGATSTNFNNLIQNVSGIAFFLDFAGGNNPSEQLFIDNICIENCESLDCDCKGLAWGQVYNASPNPSSVTCNNSNPIVIGCKKYGPNFFIHGNLLCNAVSCGDSIVKWELDRPGTLSNLNGIVSNVYPHFDIGIPWTAFTQGGNYTLTIERMCGTKKCSCKFNIFVEPCPCSCNTLHTDVLAGFNIFTGINISCKRTFKPKHLCPDDKVSWMIMKNGINITLPNTTGNNSIMYTFPSSGIYSICMKVARPNGTPPAMDSCRDTVCRKIYIHCGPIDNWPGLNCSENLVTNGNFESDTFGTIDLKYGIYEKGIKSWTIFNNAGDGQVIINEEEDSTRDGELTFIANQNNFAGIVQKTILPSGKDLKYHIGFEYYNYTETNIPTTVVIRLQSDSATKGANDLVLCCDGLGGNLQAQRNFSWQRFDTTVIVNNLNPDLKYLVLCLQNEDSTQYSTVTIDNLEICTEDKVRVSTNNTHIDQYDFIIYPNPSNNKVIIHWNEELSDVNKVVVLSITGQRLIQKSVVTGAHELQIDIEHLNEGLYLVQLVKDGHIIGTKKLIKK
ncbi:MAG: T9SS type A sorting domain-containing protein [Saprospiraceae bacterium]